MVGRFTNTFFGPDSPYLGHPALTAERTAAEVDQLETILGVGSGAALLDVGCGFGRHSIEFARRGHTVTGIDSSEAMIDAARTADESGTVRFLVRSAVDFVPDQRFDGAICMFTTLGQIETGLDDNRALLGQVRASLRPGARLVVEVPQREATVTALVGSEVFGGGDDRTEITRSFDPDTGCITESFSVTTAGTEHRFDLRYRLFSSAELAALLAAAGFVDVRMAADLGSLAKPTSSGPDPDAPTMVAAATAGSSPAAHGGSSPLGP